MKSIFSLVSILLVLAIIGLLVKKQTTSVATTPVPGVTTPGGQPLTVPSNPTVVQGREMQQQIQKSVESAMQPRPAQDGQ